MESTPTPSVERRSRRLGLVVGIILALLAVPAIVLASHQFSDVPNSSPYHAQIGALVDAGITAGCTATTYCPTANVTRAQMAAFLNRGLPYTVGDYGSGPASIFAEDFVATVTVPPRAQAGGVAYIEINASVNVADFTGACPCALWVYVADLGLGKTGFGGPNAVTLVPPPVEGGTAVEASVNWVFEVPTGEEATYGLIAMLEPLVVEPVSELAPTGISEPEIQGTLVAQYTPFGAAPAPEPVELTGPGADAFRERLEEILGR
jgi:hypothetical protein